MRIVVEFEPEYKTIEIWCPHCYRAIYFFHLKKDKEVNFQCSNCLKNFIIRKIDNKH